MLSKIVNLIDQDPNYWIKDGFLITNSRNSTAVICIPNTLINKCKIYEIIISKAHNMLGYLGPNHTLNYARWWFWWPTMASDMVTFCKTCGACQMMKSSNNKPTGLLHSLPIPSRPWESIGIDFMDPLPNSKGIMKVTSPLIFFLSYWLAYTHRTLKLIFKLIFILAPPVPKILPTSVAPTLHQLQ